MKNMKVSVKLIVSFMIVLVLAIAVGVFGIIGMFRMNEGDNRLYNNNYLPTVEAGDLAQQIVEQRVYIRNFVIYDSSEQAFKSAETSLETSEAKVLSILDAYKKTMTLAEDQAAYDEFVKIYNNEWVPMVENLHQIGAANNQAEAKTALTQATDIAGRLTSTTAKLQQINQNDGQATVNANSNLFSTMTIIEVVLLVVAAAAAIFLALYISGLISKPLVALSAFMNKAGNTGDITLNAGDQQIINAYAQIKDEVGVTIASTAIFVNRVTEVSKVLESIADGDLTAEIASLSNNDVLGGSVQKLTHNLNTMFEEINTSSSQVSVGSHQVADGAQALAAGSTEQAASVQELSSSISEVAERTKDNASKAEQAARLASTIKNSAEKGSGQMDEMMKSVKDINEASQSISKVIKTIDDIAFQTNILALNAAVEAARAGQHGKGFAVVAEEVRNLAAKSAEAAKDTEDLIADSMQKAEQGVHIAGETAASLSDIVSGINESNALITEIAQASEAQSVSIAQINTGIDQVAKVVQQNSATAQESAAASQEMSSQSAVLQELISQFKLKDGSSQRRLGTGVDRRRPGPAKRIAPPEEEYSYGDSGDFGKY